MAKTKEKIKLTRAEKKQLQALMKHNQQQNQKGPHTAQDTIPYQRMWPDGVCRVTDHYYTKTIQFQDINYQLAQNDDKTSIFEGWCDFLNYFDSTIHLQFSFLNLTASAESFEQSIIIPDRDDGFNEVRHEYAEMLQNQLAKGNNGLTKTKFITYGIEAEQYDLALSDVDQQKQTLIEINNCNLSALFPHGGPECKINLPQRIPMRDHIGRMDVPSFDQFQQFLDFPKRHCPRACNLTFSMDQAHDVSTAHGVFFTLAHKRGCAILS